MALIPSSNMYNNMLNKSEGIFFEKISDETVPFVVKIPISMIKSIHENCKIKFIMSVDCESGNCFLTVGIIMEDHPENPFVHFIHYIIKTIF